MQRRGEALVVEGYLDVLTLHQAGLTATVSPLSTTLSAAQLTALRPFVKQVVLVFDGDPAGQTAMTRVFCLPSRVTCRYGLSPCHPRTIPTHMYETMAALHSMRSSLRRFR